jgi:bifunctional non-homologous end joining protein LigD
LIDRKTLLAPLLPARLKRTVRYSEHQLGDGAKFFAAAAAIPLEGIVSKKADAPYRPGRGPAWLKVKSSLREEFIVIGWTDPEGSRIGFGRLVLGYYSQATRTLTYAGGVGTGFNDKLLAQLHKRLLAMPAPDPGIALPKGVKRSAIHWVRPEILAQIRFTEWTRDGILRHPSFLGERLDKKASEVVLDRAMSPDAKQHHWGKAKRR